MQVPHRSQSLDSRRALVPQGILQLSDAGAWYSYWQDPYHLLLTIPWPGFFLLIVLVYGILNALFALAYLAGGNGIAQAQPGSFWDAFFFSVQTLASIGYGAMYPLSLLRSETPSFPLTWTAIHPVDPDSPLWGQTTASLAQLRAQIIVSLSGIDETITQAVHARHVYQAHEILWDHRFIDIIHETPGGDRYIDFSQFHNVVASS